MNITIGINITCTRNHYKRKGKANHNNSNNIPEKTYLKWEVVVVEKTLHFYHK